MKKNLYICIAIDKCKAYKEQYPVCNKVEIHKYADGSCGSHCPFGAFGDENGGTEHQPSTECYQCTAFKERKEGEEITIVYRDE